MADREAPNRLSREQLLSALQELADELGRSPTVREMAEHGRYSEYPYRREFGSWNGAVRAAGLEPQGQYGIPESELLTALQDLADQLGHPPRRNDMRCDGPHTPDPYEDRWGSWNAALEAAGFEPQHHHDVSDEALAAEIEAVASQLGRTPKAQEAAELGAYNHKAYFRAFGSWNAALDAAGFEPLRPSPGEGEYPEYFRGGWEAKREAALERDGYECRDCGIAESEYRDEHGRGLDVHHKTPVQEYDTHKQAHHLDNLVTLCRPCHKARHRQ